MKHPGFKAVSASISKRQGIPKSRSNAILAAAARGSSKKARAKNPRLNHVPGRTLRMASY
jgi:hypothetical protein